VPADTTTRTISTLSLVNAHGSNSTPVLTVTSTSRSCNRHNVVGRPLVHGDPLVAELGRWVLGTHAFRAFAASDLLAEMGRGEGRDWTAGYPASRYRELYLPGTSEWVTPVGIPGVPRAAGADA
jgi:hypothetical protein